MRGRVEGVSALLTVCGSGVFFAGSDHKFFQKNLENLVFGRKIVKKFLGIPLFP